MTGAYAVAALDRENPDEIITARRSSPLVIDIGRDEFFLTSDAIPIVEHMGKVVYLEDGEIAVIRRGEKLKVVNLEDVECPYGVKTMAPNLDQLEKGGCPHFMLEEISEQSGYTYDRMCRRINLEGTNVVLFAIINYKERLLTTKHFVIVAHSTSWHATLIGRHLIGSFHRIPVEAEYASEFRCHDSVVDDSDVMIVISQGGEMTDTLTAVESVKNRDAFIYGICNVVGSSIPCATHTGSHIRVDPKIGVTSTKALIGQVTMLIMLVLALAREKHTVDEEQHLAIVRELGQIPEKAKEVLKSNDSVVELSRIFTYACDFIYLGRGYNYLIVLEGALKLKEISYIRVKGYLVAEIKHGPTALIDVEMPVVVITTQNELYEKVLSNIRGIKAHKDRAIAIVIKGDEITSRIADTYTEFPGTMGCLDPSITTVPLQLLVYHITVYKGMDVDQPCSFAKSAVVE